MSVSGRQEESRAIQGMRAGNDGCATSAWRTWGVERGMSADLLYGFGQFILQSHGINCCFVRGTSGETMAAVGGEIGGLHS
jgi:hypothetical protein